jgi:hypothetical protein
MTPRQRVSRRGRSRRLLVEDNDKGGVQVHVDVNVNVTQ